MCTHDLNFDLVVFLKKRLILSFILSLAENKSFEMFYIERNLFTIKYIL